MATIREENCYLSRTSRHLAVITASGAQKNKLSLQRHPPVPKLSFDIEVEELNIDQGRHNDDSSISTNSCSITNDRVCSSHIQWSNGQRHYALHKLPLLLKAAPPSETCLKAPRRRKQLQKSTSTTLSGNHESDVPH